MYKATGRFYSPRYEYRDLGGGRAEVVVFPEYWHRMTVGDFNYLYVRYLFGLGPGGGYVDLFFKVRGDELRFSDVVRREFGYVGELRRVVSVKLLVNQHTGLELGVPVVGVVFPGCEGLYVVFPERRALKGAGSYYYVDYEFRLPEGYGLWRYAYQDPDYGRFVRIWRVVRYAGGRIYFRSFNRRVFPDSVVAVPVLMLPERGVG